MSMWEIWKNTTAQHFSKGSHETIPFCEQIFHDYQELQYTLVLSIKSHYIDRPNKWEKCEHIDEAIFDIPYMIQSHAESLNKILGALSNLPAN